MPRAARDAVEPAAQQMYNRAHQNDPAEVRKITASKTYAAAAIQKIQQAAEAEMKARTAAGEGRTPFGSGRKARVPGSSYTPRGGSGGGGGGESSGEWWKGGGSGAGITGAKKGGSSGGSRSSKKGAAPNSSSYAQSPRRAGSGSASRSKSFGAPADMPGSLKTPVAAGQYAGESKYGAIHHTDFSTFFPPPVDSILMKVRKQQASFSSARKERRMLPGGNANGTGSTRGGGGGGVEDFEGLASLTSGGELQLRFLDAGGGQTSSNIMSKAEELMRAAQGGTDTSGCDMRLPTPSPPGEMVLPGPGEEGYVEPVPTSRVHRSRHSMVCGRDIDLLTGRANQAGRGTAWNAGSGGNRRRNSDGWLGPRSCWTDGPRQIPEHLLGWNGFVNEEQSLGDIFPPPKPENLPPSPDNVSPEPLTRALTPAEQAESDSRMRQEQNGFGGGDGGGGAGGGAGGGGGGGGGGKGIGARGGRRKSLVNPAMLAAINEEGSGGGGGTPGRSERGAATDFAQGDLSDVLHRPFSRFPKQVQVHFDAVRCMIAVESHDGRPPVIVSGGDGGKIAVWTIDRNAEDGSLDNFDLSLILHASGAASHAGEHEHTLMVGGQWDPYGEGNANAHEGAVNCLCEDGSYLFSASQDRTVQVWDKESHYKNVRVLVSGKKPIIGMRVNRSFGAVTNRTAGLSAGSDGGKTDGTNALVSWSLSEIRVNDLRTLEFMVCAKLQSPMDGRVASGNLAFHRKAVFIVYNRYDVASNYLNVGSRSDFFSHQEVQVKPMAITCMTCLAGFIFIGYTNGVIEKIAIDVKTGVAGDKVCDMKGHMKDVTCFAHQDRSVWSRAIQFLISGSLDESIRIWNAHTGECVNLVVESAAVVSICVARNLLICGLKKGGFHVWYPDLKAIDFEGLAEKVDADNEAAAIEMSAERRRSQRARRVAAKHERENIAHSLEHLTTVTEDDALTPRSRADSGPQVAVQKV